MSDLCFQFFGRDSLTGAVEAWPHIKGLLREVSRAYVGEADAIPWRITDLRVICDRCERTRPKEHAAWINDGIYDYCLPCARETLMGCAP